METGTPTLYRIAADYGVSRQYVSRLAQRVKKIRTPGVD
jgi:DNA-directed RNA polymerase specialized sigma subunit